METVMKMLKEIEQRIQVLAFSEKDVQCTVLDLLLHYSDMSNYLMIIVWKILDI